MPASTKPMKRGTAEHEQNGVTMPSEAAPDGADELPATDEGVAHLLGREEAPDEGDRGHDAEEQQEHLRHVEDEEGDRVAQVRALLEAQQVVGEPGGERRGGEPRNEPGDHSQKRSGPEGHPDMAPDCDGGHSSTSRSVARARRHASSSRS